MDQELKAYLDAMQESLVTRMVDLNTETRAQAREHAERLHTKAVVLIEAVHQDVRIVAEGVATVNEKLDRIADDHEQRIQRLERKAP